MFLVATDPRFGAVVAPATPDDLTDEAAVTCLKEAGFEWNEAEEMFACVVGGPDAARDLASWASGMLAVLGHDVIVRHLTAEDVQGH